MTFLYIKQFISMKSFFSPVLTRKSRKAQVVIKELTICIFWCRERTRYIVRRKSEKRKEKKKCLTD